MRCAAEGVPPEDARAELVRNGIEPEQAGWLVDSAYGLAPAPAGSAPYSPAVLPPALLAGLVAAVVGGVGWTIQVALTEYELGLVAWAIGGLAGFAVARAAGNRRGLPLQLVAVGSALLGILLGKYGTYVWTVRDQLADAGLPAEVIPDWWDTGLLDAFLEDLDVVFGWFDLLWVAFAVFTAWRMLQPVGD